MFLQEGRPAGLGGDHPLRRVRVASPARGLEAAGPPRCWLASPRLGTLREQAGGGVAFPDPATFCG